MLYYAHNYNDNNNILEGNFLSVGVCMCMCVYSRSHLYPPTKTHKKDQQFRFALNNVMSHP